MTWMGLCCRSYRSRVPSTSWRCDEGRPGTGQMGRNLGRCGTVRAAAGDRAGGGRRVLADPLVLPRLVVLLGVAARLVHRHELTGYLLPVRPAAARHLVRADVYLPPGSGPAHPAVRTRVLKGEALGGEVIAVAHVDDRVPAGPGVWFRLVRDRVDGRGRRRCPPAEQARALEWVPGK